MNTITLIPIVPSTINGHACQMVDARTLHAFLDVRRDFSNWIKGRIDEFAFEQSVDYLLAKSGEQVPHQGGLRTVSRGQRQAINRQAWADVSDQAQAAFHARREQLLRECIDNPEQRQRCIPEHLVPLWARLKV